MGFIGIIKRSAEIVWRNKFLWVLGILPIFLVEIIRLSFEVFRADEQELLLMHKNWASLAVFAQEMVEFTIWSRLTLFLFSIAVIVLGILLELSLFRAAAQIYFGQEHENLGQLVKRSRRQFWSRVGLEFFMLAVAIFIALPLVVIGKLTESITNLEIELGIQLGLVEIFFFAFLLINVVKQESIAAMVVEKLPANDAYPRGFKLVKMNIFKYLPLALFYCLLIVGFRVTTELPFAYRLLPQIPPVISEAVLYDLTYKFEWYLDLNFTTMRPLIWWPLVIVIEGLMTAFTTTLWTVMFLDNRDNPEPETTEIGEPAIT